MLKNYKILIIYCLLICRIFASDLSFFSKNYLFSDKNKFNNDMNMNGQVQKDSSLAMILGIKKIDSKKLTEFSITKNSNDKIDLYELFHQRKIKYGEVKFGKFVLNDSSIYDNQLSMGHPFISKNAPPIWGIDINQKYNFKGFEISFNFYNGQISSLDEYLWNRDYSVNINTSYEVEPFIHAKSILFSKKIKNNIFSLKLNHGGIWGGTTNKNGRITSYPKNFDAFKRIVLIRSGIKNSTDSRPKIANQNGSIDFYFERGNSIFYYINYFEDGSGKSFKNKFDGLWGFNFSKNNQKWLVEILKTKHQSGNTHVMGQKSGVDSYYWHDQYVQGWTINGFSIGNYYISPNNNRKLVYRLGYFIENEKWDLNIKLDYLNIYPTFGAKKLPENYEVNKSIDNSFYSQLTYKLKLSNELSISFDTFSKDDEWMFGSKIVWNKIF